MTLIPTSDQFMEADREILATLIRHPLFVEAINTCIREAQPHASQMAKLTLEQHAFIANQLSGMNNLVFRLQELASPIATTLPVTDAASAVSGWEYHETEAP